MKTLIVSAFVLCTILWATHTEALANIDNAAFTAVLHDHVKDGRVNYKAIKQDKRFWEYIDVLKKTDPDSFSGNDKLAFWINVYNAFTLKLICDNLPVKKITDLNGFGGLVVGTVLKTTIWDKETVEVGGKKYTLNHVEHKIVRPMGDPRVHFALVCAAKSCPNLRSEAYEAARVNDQLEEQGRIFLSQSKKNSFDFGKKTCEISMIFNWFKGDFEKNGKSALQYLSRFLPKEQGDKVAAEAANFSISYTDYDWTLND